MADSESPLKRIDAFAHALPIELRTSVLDRASSNSDLVNWANLRTLFDTEARLELMDSLGIDVQVLTTPSPPLETMFDVGTTRYMAQKANDAMARLVGEQPSRFRGVATVPLIDPDWAIEELQRCVHDLGLLGPLVYTHVQGRPLDDPGIEPFWDAVEELGAVTWIHPDRPRTTPDYATEDESRYGMFLVLGWPYETSVALTRLVLSGVMARHPRLEILAHHGGAMIPTFHKRIEMNFRGGQARVPGLTDESIDIDRDLRRFYVDTVLQGSDGAVESAIRFFGPGRVLFATDIPFGPGEGRDFARSSLESVERLPGDLRRSILGENARSLLDLET